MVGVENKLLHNTDNLMHQVSTSTMVPRTVTNCKGSMVLQFTTVTASALKVFKLQDYRGPPLKL